MLWKAGQIEDGVFSLAEDIVKQDELLGRVDNATDGTCDNVVFGLKYSLALFNV